MSSGQLYDTIGATYTVTRRTEPRICTRSSWSPSPPRTPATPWGLGRLWAKRPFVQRHRWLI